MNILTLRSDTFVIRSYKLLLCMEVYTMKEKKSVSHKSANIKWKRRNQRNQVVLESLTGELEYPLTNDFLFHVMMQENIEALTHLICAMIDIPVGSVVSLEVLNPITYGSSVKDKSCIMDLRLLLNNNRYINLEMQVSMQSYFKQRTITYLCKTYDNLKSGEEYDLVTPSLQLSILDFDLFDGIEELCSRYYLINENIEYLNRYTDDFGVITLNLRQMINPKVLAREGDSELYQWAKFFKAKTWEELRMLAKENDQINNCVCSVAKLTAEEKFRMECEARKDQLALEIGIRKRLQRQALDEGRAEGRAEGKAEGIAEGKAEEREAGIQALVISLLEFNVPKNQILDKVCARYQLTKEQAAEKTAVYFT